MRCVHANREVNPPPATADALWRVHGIALLRFGTVLVGPSDAHDVVVEALLRAVETIDAGHVDNPLAYLYRAVANGAHDYRRSRHRRWTRDLHALAATVTSDPTPDIDIQRAMATLSVRQRAVVYLAYWDDMSERAIASTLGLSPGSVRRHLVRARVHLKAALR